MHKPVNKAFEINYKIMREYIDMKEQLKPQLWYGLSNFEAMVYARARVLYLAACKNKHLMHTVKTSLYKEISGIEQYALMTEEFPNAFPDSNSLILPVWMLFFTAEEALNTRSSVVGFALAYILAREENNIEAGEYAWNILEASLASRGIKKNMKDIMNIINVLDKERISNNMDDKLPFKDGYSLAIYIESRTRFSGITSESDRRIGTKVLENASKREFAEILSQYVEKEVFMELWAGNDATSIDRECGMYELYDTNRERILKMLQNTLTLCIRRQAEYCEFDDDSEETYKDYRDKDENVDEKILLGHLVQFAAMYERGKTEIIPDLRIHEKETDALNQNIKNLQNELKNERFYRTDAERKLKEEIEHRKAEAVNKGGSAKKNKEIATLTRRNELLEQEIADKQAEIDSANEAIENLLEMMSSQNDTTDENPDKEETDIMAYMLNNDVKGLVIGGHGNHIKRLKEYFPTWSFYPYDSMIVPKDAIQHADIIAFCITYMSHAQFIRSYSIAKNAGVECVFINYKNTEFAVKELYDRVSNKKKNKKRKKAC